MMHRYPPRAGWRLLLLALLLATPERALAQQAAPAGAEATAQAHLEWGRRHWDARRYTESAAAYRRATRASPDDPRAFAGLGRAYAALGAYGFAEPAYRRAIELLPDPPAALAVAHGDCLAALGDRVGAASSYRAALRRDPANEAARGALGVAQPSVTRAPRRAAMPGVTVEPRHSGVPLVAGGIPLAVVGLATGLGCGISYALEAREVGSGRAGTDPLTWAGCIGAGAVLMTGGLIMMSFGLVEGVGGTSTVAAQPGDVRAAVSPTRGGVRADVQVRF